MILVGNKMDLNALRDVPYTVGVRFARENRLMTVGGQKELFVETSALDQITVDNAFIRLFKEFALVRKQASAGAAGLRGYGALEGGPGGSGLGGGPTRAVRSGGGGGCC